VRLVSFFITFFALIVSGFAETSTPNWTGTYAPCNRHSDLLSTGHLDLGVRISTSNSALVHEFKHAMDFWTSVLDLEWHNVDSDDCAIQLLDGTPALFNWCACTSARSQLPDRSGFQGWIAFNPQVKLSKQEMFLDSVHEIGHLLGLNHNPNESSIMFFYGLEKFEWLEPYDLSALSVKHALRPGFVRGHGFSKVPVTAPDRPVHSRFNPASWLQAGR
jgi:hypothetical protein